MGVFYDYTRAAVIFVVGLILTFFLKVGGYFAPILTLDVLSDVSPTLVVVVGVLAMIAGVLIAIKESRIIGYIIGVMVTGIFAVSGMISLFTSPAPHSALVFLLIPAAISYAGGMFLAIREKYGS